MNTTYLQVGRKWIKVPLAKMEPPKTVLPKQDLSQPRGYRHGGMDHF